MPPLRWLRSQVTSWETLGRLPILAAGSAVSTRSEATAHSPRRRRTAVRRWKAEGPVASVAGALVSARPVGNRRILAPDGCAGAVGSAGTSAVAVSVPVDI